MPRKFHKHKLLLDENFHTNDFLPLTKSIFDVKHIVEDFHQSGLNDLQVYEFSARRKRLIVTFNIKHFRSMAPLSNNTGIIGVTSNLTIEQIDKKLTALLRKKTPGELYSAYNAI